MSSLFILDFYIWQYRFSLQCSFLFWGEDTYILSLLPVPALPLPAKQLSHVILELVHYTCLAGKHRQRQKKKKIFKNNVLLNCWSKLWKNWPLGGLSFTGVPFPAFQWRRSSCRYIPNVMPGHENFLAISLKKAWLTHTLN